MFQHTLCGKWKVWVNEFTYRLEMQVNTKSLERPSNMYSVLSFFNAITLNTHFRPSINLSSSHGGQPLVKSMHFISTWSWKRPLITAWRAALPLNDCVVWINRAHYFWSNQCYAGFRRWWLNFKCVLMTACCGVWGEETFSGFTVWIGLLLQAVLGTTYVFSLPPTIHFNLLLILWVTITRESSISHCCLFEWTAMIVTLLAQYNFCKMFFLLLITIVLHLPWPPKSFD